MDGKPESRLASVTIGIAAHLQHSQRKLTTHKCVQWTAPMVTKPLKKVWSIYLRIR